VPTETFEQYAALKAKPIYTGECPYSDIVLSSSNSARKSNHNFTFVQAHPVALRGIDFDTQATDIEPMVAEVTFKYVYMTHEKVLTA